MQGVLNIVLVGLVVLYGVARFMVSMYGRKALKSSANHWQIERTIDRDREKFEVRWSVTGQKQQWIKVDFREDLVLLKLTIEDYLRRHK